MTVGILQFQLFWNQLLVYLFVDTLTNTPPFHLINRSSVIPVITVKIGPWVLSSFGILVKLVDFTMKFGRFQGMESGGFHYEIWWISGS